MTYLVVSCSLNPESYGAQLASRACDSFAKRGKSCVLADLRDYKLPFASGVNLSQEADGQVAELHNIVEASEGIILVAPVYNYGISACARNFIELTGSPHGEELSGAGWHRKVVGLITVAASPASLMAPLDLMNGLLMWYHCVIVPSFVCASHLDYSSRKPSDSLCAKIDTLISDTCLFTDSLRQYWQEPAKRT